MYDALHSYLQYCSKTFARDLPAVEEGEEQEGQYTHYQGVVDYVHGGVHGVLP